MPDIASKTMRALLPPPRRPMSAGRVMPLVLFLVIFIGGCVFVDAMDWILFSRLSPFWFLLFAPWLWWMFEAGYAGLSRKRAMIALWSRLFLLGLFIVLLCEPRMVRKDDGLSVVFVVDASASVREEARQEAIRFALKLSSNKPSGDRAGLVFFGADAAVELPPGPTLPYDENNTVMNVQIDHDGTNIAEALSLAAAMLSEDQNGRIVLISDGAETEGNVVAAMDQLKAKGIAVDVLPITYEYDHEVWLERLELPRNVKIGETYEASVNLSSLKAGKGELVLMENDQEIFRQKDVEFTAGKNRFDIPIYLRQPGYYEYVAQITVDSDKDSKKQNNKAISHLYLQGKGKVLIVSDPQGDPRDYEHLVAALREAERDVEVRNAYEFPRNALALLPYDAVIFANAPASAFDAVQLDAMHEAVYAQGTGFLMIGGENSYGPGGYHRTAVEKALPVSMDLSQKKILPKGALVIILHTCEFPQGNTWGKNITKQAIKVLDDRDEVGVLIQDFTGTDRWLFNLTPASQYEDLAKQINNVQIGDMMDFVPTMRLALNALKASDASAKHVIIISDGDPSPPPGALLQSFRDNNISITTVAMFPHSGNGGPETQLMSSIAQLTGGRYYLPQNPNLLPSIFIKEATTLRRSAIQEIKFTPNVSVTSEILDGIDGLRQLDGYVLTTPKARSLTILDGPEEEELDPVLSTWRYGLGAAAAWTSDMSPRWASNWISWEKFSAFVKQLVTHISRTSGDGHLRMRSFPAGGQGIVLVEDYAPEESFLEMQAQIEGPHGAPKTIDMKQVGPRRYEGRFPLQGQGRYRVTSVALGDNRKAERTHGGFVVPYSQEYLRFRANPIVLQKIANKTGGRELAGNETGEFVFTKERDAKQSSKPVIDWFLILLACLIPLDVGLRRVQVDMDTVKGWFAGRRDMPSAETFTALLKRKQDVSSSLRHEEKPRTTQGPNFDMGNDDGVKRPSLTDEQRQAARQGEPEEEPQSVTERLLQAKRRAQEQKGDDEEA